MSSSSIASFSIDDGDASENATLKMKSRFFKLWGVYYNLLKMSLYEVDEDESLWNSDY